MDWKEKQRYLNDAPPQGASWLENMNRSVTYIEENLDGTIEAERAAQIAGCSTYHYQRIFSWLAGIPLAEYIRRRRLTLAAFALQRGEKVIDVALRYGYGATESFSRAFKGLHGILPSTACREGAMLQACPPIVFHISVRGDVAMQYRIEQKGAFSLFGRSIPVNTQSGEQSSVVPAFWQRVREDGTGASIRQMAGLAERTPLHGAIYDCTDAGYQYLIGAFAPSGAVPKIFTVLEVPAGAWAVFPLQPGGMSEIMAGAQQLWGRIFSEWFATSGYHLRAAPELELHFGLEDGQYTAEIWIPIED